MDCSATISLGTALRQERVKRNLDLAVIAKETRICPAILEAIEKDKFECIPGGAYRRHFLRQYARALGMDGDAAVAEFRKQFEEPPLPLPVPPKTRHSPLWADLGWAVVVVASVAAVYQWVVNKHSVMQPQEQAAMQPASIHQSALPERPEAPPSSSPPQAARAAAPETPAATPGQPSSAAPSSVEPSSTAEPPAGLLHVAFTASEPVWVSVKCDGNTSYAGVLEAAQSKTFDAHGVVTAVIGNAGGVLISLNGKPIGPLGGHGQVEMVELTPKGVHRVARNTESPAEPTPATHPDQ